MKQERTPLWVWVGVCLLILIVLVACGFMAGYLVSRLGHYGSLSGLSNLQVNPQPAAPTSTAAQPFSSLFQQSLDQAHAARMQELSSYVPAYHSAADMQRSVVHIATNLTTCCDENNEPIESEWSGAGVVLSVTGPIAVVVTNRHVVDCAYTDACTVDRTEHITIRTNDGHVYLPLDVRYAPSDVDLAFLSFYLPPEDTVLPAYIDYAYTAPVATDVYAIGSPFELEGTVTEGIVSADPATRPVTYGDLQLNEYQTSAPVNPGNSGGGLFEKNTGRLLGIVTYKYGEATGFALNAQFLYPLYRNSLACAQDYSLFNNSCVQCPPSTVLGVTDGDGQCHPPCFWNPSRAEFIWCSSESDCRSSQCGKGFQASTVCEQGYYLGDDDMCYPYQ